MVISLSRELVTLEGTDGIGLACLVLKKSMLAASNFQEVVTK